MLYWVIENAMAKNCGVIGAIYPIAEIDLRQVIQQRLLTWQHNGGFDQWNIKFNQTLQQRMDRPLPVMGLHRTFQSRTWLFNPSVRIPYDLKNANGDIVLPVGTTVNPLDTVSLSETLLFYNADDLDQVRWAQRQDEQLKGKDKLILVKGSVISQITLFKKSVFFDQGGRLTTRFGITQIPAIITQQGNRLKIQEVQP